MRLTVVGTILADDVSALDALGVAGVLPFGAPTEEIVEVLCARTRQVPALGKGL